MSRRQPPIIRAGSGDSHEARLAVLEKRFSEDMQARCSWCSEIRGAKEGNWIEILLSTPGTGIATSHVFRCLNCETALPSAMGPGIVAVPRRSSREAAAEPGSPPVPPALDDLREAARQSRVSDPAPASEPKKQVKSPAKKAPQTSPLRPKLAGGAG